jgi:hypothetical protein
MIPTRDAIEAHASWYTTEFILSILEAFAQCTQSLNGTKCLMFSVCVLAELSLLPIAVLSPPYCQHPPHRARHALPAGTVCWSAIYMHYLPHYTMPLTNVHNLHTESLKTSNLTQSITTSCVHQFMKDATLPVKSVWRRVRRICF